MRTLRLAALGCLSTSAALADVSYVDFSSTAGLTLVGSAAGLGDELVESVRAELPRAKALVLAKRLR